MKFYYYLGLHPCDTCSIPFWSLLITAYFSDRTKSCLLLVETGESEAQIFIFNYGSVNKLDIFSNFSCFQM